MPKPYTPKYFESIADYYSQESDTAKRYGANPAVCHLLLSAAIQLRIAAEHLRKAQS